MPDFANLRKALLCQGEPTRVPPFELSVDEAIKRRFLDRPDDQPWRLEDEVEFFMKAGYDFVPLTLGIRQVTRGEGSGLTGGQPVHTSLLKPAQARYNPFQAETSTRMWAEEGEGIICNEAAFEQYDWPDPDTFDYDVVRRLEKLLPDGAMTIVLVGAVFTASWMYMGMEQFFLAVAEGSRVVLRLMDKIGQIQKRVVQNLLQFDCVGAVCMPDDLAHSRGLLVNPRVLREHVFPWNKQIGDLVRARGLAYLYHSDGCIYPVIDDLLDCGFNAIHPCERASMDIARLKRKYSGRLCLCGNIDLDTTLTLGTPADVEAEVRKRIRTIGPGGGYCCGSSNSVPEYVPLDNYLAMIEAVKRYGEYPLA